MKLSGYRPVNGENGYADWVKKLKGKSGVYVIRNRGFFGQGGDVVYVGESHTGNLYKTLTRHFQYRASSDPQSDSTYGAGSVLVAIKRCKAGDAIVVQDAMICAMRPRDNKQTACGDGSEDDPFEDDTF